jgi:signal transduction histidine kinase
MRERATLIGARLTLRSQKGDGASVILEAPLG